MPQRAIIEEKAGKKEIHAYQLTDPQWIGVIEASKAGVLKLPCCGQSALPRDPRGMVRHFAHPPYTLENCEAKASDATRDYIIVQVAEMAEQLGWTIQTEAKIANNFCDLVCRLNEYEISIGIEIETGRRDNDELLRLDRDLRLNGLLLVQWFFKKGRHGGYSSVTHQFISSMQERQEASKLFTDHCRKLLSDIDGLFKMAEKLCDDLNKSGLEHELHKKAGLPDHVIVRFNEEEEIHRIDLSFAKVKMTNPEVAVHRQNMVRGEALGEQQKTLIAIVSENLAAGVALWWDGHPTLLADSFRRLRANIELEDSRRKQHQAKLHTAYGVRSQITADHESDLPEKNIGLNPHQQSPVFKRSTSMGGGYTDLRLKEAQCILQDYYGENYSDEILDMPFHDLGGKSPRQLVESTSQSTEKLHIALGYRDPKTKKPLKRLPEFLL